jgi:hypothetical protein
VQIKSIVIARVKQRVKDQVHDYICSQVPPQVYSQINSGSFTTTGMEIWTHLIIDVKEWYAD